MSANTSPHDLQPQLFAGEDGSGSLKHAARVILLAGFCAGCLDLAFALIWFGQHGKTPTQLLESIAGGAFGSRAFDGGIEMAALGVCFHFIISFGAATVFYIASRCFAFVNRFAWICGLIFGLIVYEFMHLVVLPLSAYHRPVAIPPLFTADVLSHLVFVGCTIALIVRHFAAAGSPARTATP